MEAEDSENLVFKRATESKYRHETRQRLKMSENDCIIQYR